jgi:ABC-2 type transport system ATP-binding protein
MAIDVELLILDEPTLGLDIIYRQEFYDRLLTQFYDGSQTIVISTHQVEEIESLLSHLIFISHGKIVFSTEMEALQQRFVEVAVAADNYSEADDLRPIYSRATLGGKDYLFELEEGDRGVGDRSRYERLGRVSTPSVADVFVAKLGDSHG